MTTEQTEAQSDLIPDGTVVPAKAGTWALDVTKTQNQRLRVMFALAGAYGGRHLTWDGYFSEGAFARTIESMRNMGWQGADLSDLQGLDTNEVDLVIGVEEYEGKTYNRVKWVNRKAALFLSNPMDDAQKASFAQQMKGRILALELGKPKNGPAAKPSPRPAGPPAPTNDDIPF